MYYVVEVVEKRISRYQVHLDLVNGNYDDEDEEDVARGIALERHENGTSKEDTIHLSTLTEPQIDTEVVNAGPNSFFSEEAAGSF